MTAARSVNGGAVQSVSRALRLLDYVAACREGATAKEIATHLAMALPSTYHLLRTLVDAGYLVHLSQERRYGLGYRIQALGEGLAQQLEVPAGAAAAIRRLHVDADAAAYYATYRDCEVVIAHVVDSERRPRVRPLDVGFHEAAHATAFGKVMLAAMDPDARADYLARASLRRLTGRTIVDRAALESHLEHVRGARIAVEIGEFQDGLSCLAAAVRGPAGVVVGSVAISLPSAEFATRRWAVERAVRQSSTAVTRALITAARPSA